MIVRGPRLLALLVLAAVALGACDAGTKLPAERTWNLVLPGVAGTAQLPVAVVDETGTVKLAELAGGRFPAIEGFGGAGNVDGDTTRILVGWIGGSCDQRAEVRFVRSGAGFRGTVKTTVAAGGCDAMGIQRAVILDLANGLEVVPATVDVIAG